MPGVPKASRVLEEREMGELLKTCLLICPLIFLGGFIDSVAGGGGLITLPAYLLVNVPVHMAAGTNKVVNGIGTCTATIKYLRSGKIYLRVALWAAVGALAGSAAGAQIALHIPAQLLKLLMLAALPAVAIFLSLKKDFGQVKEGVSFSPLREQLTGLGIGLAMGCYDGVVGPGTGTFMIMAFTALLNMDLITASGCAKMGNLASNVAAAVVFILSGQVWWAVVVPAALCNALGNYCGARYAIRGGSRKIRRMIFVVLGLLFVKMIWELLAG